MSKEPKDGLKTELNVPVRGINFEKVIKNILQLTPRALATFLYRFADSLNKEQQQTLSDYLKQKQQKDTQN